ncbi:hypothetical protein CPB85DRAFT_1215337 [Mucidula mucida]|nr:hypothetical protein CPB85DRAFT_1215337 [Mucidula mucida]
MANLQAFGCLPDNPPHLRIDPGLFNRLQLSLFFMLVTVSLWIESLFNGVASEVAQFPAFYKATAFITVFVPVIPWLISGWFAVRKEKRKLMFIFLFLALLYLTGWAVMFYSDSFRWTFLNWLFFSIMASLSVALTVTVFILGVICRYNFGKGLPHFLNPDESFSDTDSTHSFDEEKVAFPSRESRFQVRPFSLVFDRVRAPVAAAPPIPEMPRDIPAEPTVAPPTFMGSGGRWNRAAIKICHLHGPGLENSSCEVIPHPLR